MKRLYFLCATLSIFSLGATAQVALPLSVDKDVFNADSIFVEKTRVGWDHTESAVKTDNFQDGGVAVFTFKDTPGMLHLDYSRTRYGKSNVMLIQESTDGKEFTDIYNGAASTSWTNLSANLSKDTRYIKLYYDAKYTFGDVGSRMGYWRNINVTEPIASQTDAAVLSMEYGSKAKGTFSVAYSNPAGDIVVTTADHHITFGPEGSTSFTISGVAGKEGSAIVDFCYDSALEPMQVGELTSLFTVADSGNEGYTKEYKLVANIDAPIMISRREGSMTTVVGQQATDTFNVTYLPTLSADDITVTSSADDVAASVAPDADAENTLVVTLTYAPQAAAKDAQATVSVAEATSGMSLTYVLTLNAYQANSVITTVDEYNDFASIANQGFKVDAELAADLEFSAENPNVQITNFSGSFDGKRHTIKGYGAAEEPALFAGSSLTGSVRNLALDNVSLLDADVQSTDEDGNGLSVECCYGTPSDTPALQLMNYAYMNTEKVINCFTRVRGEEIDPTTGERATMYLYKLSGGTLGMLEADSRTIEGKSACFALWKLLDSEDGAPSVFGMKIGADEMPSFLTADNAISTARYFANVADAQGGVLYAQDGRYYADNLSEFDFEADANDFIVLDADSETLGSDSVASLSANVITADGKANLVRLTDGEDYFFPSASGLQQIAAARVEYERQQSRNGLYEPYALPFDITASSLQDQFEGDQFDIAFLDPSKNVIDEARSQIILQSASNEEYKGSVAKTIPAGMPFFFSLSGVDGDAAVQTVISFVGENVVLTDLSATPVDYLPLKGTFSSTSASSMAGEEFYAYMLSQLTDADKAQLLFSAASDASVEAFRNCILLHGSITDGGVKPFSLVIDKGAADGISEVASNSSAVASAIYNLAGQRVLRMLPGQVYVSGGKKFVMK